MKAPPHNIKSICHFFRIVLIGLFTTGCVSVSNFDPSIYRNVNTDKIKLHIQPNMGLINQGANAGLLAFGIVGAGLTALSTRGKIRSTREMLNLVNSDISQLGLTKEIEMMLVSAFDQTLYPSKPEFVKSDKVHLNTMGISITASANFNIDLDQIFVSVLFISNLSKDIRSTRSYLSIYSTPSDLNSREANATGLAMKVLLLKAQLKAV
ncbi:MAG: hypothetical protein KTR18_16585 [Acidiferrobacterales bacterium]|nr:hypothetical protein [Acidiferrobacterales bacterium]